MRHAILKTTAVAGLAVLLAACGGGSSAPGGGTTSSGEPSEGAFPDLSGQTISVDAVWTGAEQETFQKLMSDFESKTGAKFNYTSTGDQIATVLGTKVQGGSPPDVAILPQPGLLNQFAKAGNLQPLSDEASAAVDANYSPIWKELGSVDGKAYGVWVDASNKSTVWYNTKEFDNAGISSEPQTWEDFLAAGKTLADAGVKVPVSIGGADGWTLTDWFENVYLRSAGADKYDQLSTHDIKWTDPSVEEALKTLAQLFGDKTLIGDPNRALQVDFPTSVTNTFSANPSSAIVFEGSFVAGVISSSTPSKVGTDAKWFPFPSINGSSPSVVGGGDVAVAFKDTPGAKAFLQYLATPEAAALMVSTGSFTSANKNLDPSAYPDDNSRAVGQAIVDAGDNFRFDMSDLAPPAFGGTKGAGEWKDLQDFLANPNNIQGTMKQLEADAAAAFK